MNYYECTYILKGDLEESEAEKVGGTIKELIEKEGGVVLRMDDWGKKRLAYAIKKQKYGYYLFAQYQLDAANNKSLDWNLKLSDSILKYLIIKIDESDLLKDEKPKVASGEGDAESEETAKANSVEKE